MDEFKLRELLQQLRYYGQLRFAIFALFMAITAGLLMAFHRTEVGFNRLALTATGIIFALVFGYFQLKLSAIHSLCLSELQKLAEKEHKLGQRFVNLLFGETLEDRMTNYLQPVKNFLQPRLRIIIDDKSIDYLGPVTILVVLLHTLLVVLWLVLFIFGE